MQAKAQLSQLLLQLSGFSKSSEDSGQDHVVQTFQSQPMCLKSIPFNRLEQSMFKPLVLKLFFHFNPSISSVQSLSHVRLFATPWTAAHQASLSITNSQSLLKLTYIGLVVPSNHLILCCPLLLLPSVFPSIRVFANESALRIRWPKYQSFNFNISPSNEHSGMISLIALIRVYTTNFHLYNSFSKSSYEIKNVIN